MLRKIRNIAFINLLLRFLLIRTLLISKELIARWRVSGVIKINFFSYSFKMYSKADDGIVDQLFYKKDYIEKSDLQLFSCLARNAKTILDIGANTGIYTIVASLSNPNSKIYAFEPNPVNIKRFKKNIHLNKLNNITIIEKALGEREDTISFTVPKANIISDTSSAIQEFSENTYKGRICWKQILIDQTSLNHFIKIEEVNSVDLMKVDVEGYEVQVLEGAKYFFEKYSPIVILESFPDEGKKAYLNKFIKKYSYIPYLMLNEGVVRLDRGIIKNTNGLNYLLSKKMTSAVFTSYKNMSLLIKEIT